MTFSCCSPTDSVEKRGSSPCLTHLQLSHQNPLCLTPMNAVGLSQMGTTWLSSVFGVSSICQPLCHLLLLYDTAWFFSLPS